MYWFDVVFDHPEARLHFSVAALLASHPPARAMVTCGLRANSRFEGRPRQPHRGVTRGGGAALAPRPWAAMVPRRSRAPFRLCALSGRRRVPPLPRESLSAQRVGRRCCTEALADEGAPASRKLGALRPAIFSMRIRWVRARVSSRLSLPLSLCRGSKIGVGTTAPKSGEGIARRSGWTRCRNARVRTNIGAAAAS